MLNMSRIRRCLDLRETREGLCVTAGNGSPAFPEPLAARQLVHAQGSSNICHVIFVASLQHLVIPGSFSSVALPGIPADAMQGHHCGPFSIGGICRGEHTALARR